MELRFCARYRLTEPPIKHQRLVFLWIGKLHMDVYAKIFRVTEFSRRCKLVLFAVVRYSLLFLCMMPVAQAFVHVDVNRNVPATNIGEPDYENQSSIAKVPTQYITEDYRQSYARKIAESILAKVNGKASVGIKLQSVKNGEVMFAQNTHKLLVPASNAKIFTAVAALTYLGPEYVFNTQLLTSPKAIVSNKTLNGDLYIKFSGDPSLTSADISQLFATLKQRGVNRINGHVYIDDSVFSGSSLGPGWLGADTRYCYSAPISGVIIDHNCPRFLYQPKAKKVATICSHKYTKRGKKHVRRNSCLRVRHKASPYYVQRVLHNPHEYAKGLVEQLLTQQHISVSGEISRAAANKNMQIVALHRSEPLAELLTKMLKESDNLFADAIFKKLGSVYFDESGNWENGSLAVKNILTEKAHLNMNNLRLVDGSGMSRYNLVTADEVTDLLNYAYHRLPYATDFIQALPVGGIDGTLARRMHKMDLRGRVRAKTGTMHSVTALSGYLETTHDDVLVFSIIFNGFYGSGRYYRAISDELLTESARRL